MDHYFWQNVFEPTKNRRPAHLFLKVLFWMLGTLIGLVVLHDMLSPNEEYFYATVGSLVFVLLLRLAVRLRRCRQQRYQSSPLSRDELNKARSKLIRTKY